MKTRVDKTKRGIRKIGYLFTWPIAQVYRVVRFLNDIQLGSLFAGVMFILLAIVGAMEYRNGSSLGEILFFYTFIYMIVASLGAWVINTVLYLVMRLLRPAYQANRRCVDEAEREIRQEAPIDEFIKASSHIEPYSFRKLS